MVRFVKGDTIKIDSVERDASYYYNKLPEELHNVKQSSVIA